MIQLDSKILPDSEQTTLNDLQQKVNQEATFPLKVEKAQNLWSSKGNTAGKRAFESIREKLLDMCVYEGVCNYCEQNEANDIEHIHPKSFFPEFTFVWDNYILACKQCNSAYKLDKCLVLDDNGDLFNVERRTEPAFKIHAFINPRIENPNDFMVLETTTFQFVKLPELDKSDANRVEATLQILALNDRDTLIAARKSAAQFYYQRMELLTRILAADSVIQIEQLLSPYDQYITSSQSLTSLKAEIKDGFKKQIQTYQHPSVWYSIKLIDSRINVKWRTLFQKLPEALSW